MQTANDELIDFYAKGYEVLTSIHVLMGWGIDWCETKKMVEFSMILNEVDQIYEFMNHWWTPTEESKSSRNRSKIWPNLWDDRDVSGWTPLRSLEQLLPLLQFFALQVLECLGLQKPVKVWWISGLGMFIRSDNMGIVFFLLLYSLLIAYMFPAKFIV